jgi:hypothetical protein
MQTAFYAEAFCFPTMMILMTNKNLIRVSILYIYLVLIKYYRKKREKIKHH